MEPVHQISVNARNLPPLTLSQLNAGEYAKVLKLLPCAAAYRHKLLAMGLTRGAKLHVVRRAPLGDPLQIELRGFSLSLRKREAQLIQVERVDP